jgi:NADPH:quinone reductase-like Zn-dependent oxidoreductase
MKAALASGYGPPEVVSIAERPVPPLRSGQELVGVLAAAVTVGDARIRAARAPAGLNLLMRLAFGLFRPRRPVLGMFFAGRMAGAGNIHNDGDRVMGVTGMAMGAHAEVVAVDEKRLVPVPAGLSDAEAAALMFGGLTAADFLIDKAALRRGERVLINGASGEVGLAACQIARHLGAEVMAICSAPNHDFVRAFGANRTHDYREGLPVGTWDVVMDIAGTLPFAKARALIAPGGRFLPVTASLPQMIGGALRSQRAGIRITGTTTADGPEALRRLIELYEAGAIRPVIGASFPFSEIRAAHALADSGHKRGSVIVRMDQATETAMAAK